MADYDWGDWKGQLPPEIRDNPVMAKYATPIDVSTALIAAQPLIGADKIPVPRGPDDKNWPVIYDRLGRPTEASGYKMPEVKDLPQGFQVEQKNVDEYLAIAHKIGLSQTQAAALYSHYIGQQGGSYKGALDMIEESRVAVEKALKVEWGNGYEAQLALGRKTLTFALGQDEGGQLSARYGNDPLFIKLLARLGNELSEDILGEGAPKPGDLTPEAAQKEINAIMGDPKHAYFTREHPDHKNAVSHMEDLHAIAHPETAEAT